MSSVRRCCCCGATRPATGCRGDAGVPGGPLGFDGGGHPLHWAAGLQANPECAPRSSCSRSCSRFSGPSKRGFWVSAHVGSAGDRAWMRAGGRQPGDRRRPSRSMRMRVEVSRRPGWQGVPPSRSRAPSGSRPPSPCGRSHPAPWPTPPASSSSWGLGSDSRTLMACSEPSSCAARTGSSSRSRMFMYVFAKAIVRLGLRSRRTESRVTSRSRRPPRLGRLLRAGEPGSGSGLPPRARLRPLGRSRAPPASALRRSKVAELLLDSSQVAQARLSRSGSPIRRWSTRHPRRSDAVDITLVQLRRPQHGHRVRLPLVVPTTRAVARLWRASSPARSRAL